MDGSVRLCVAPLYVSSGEEEEASSVVGSSRPRVKMRPSRGRREGRQAQTMETFACASGFGSVVW